MVLTTLQPETSMWLHAADRTEGHGGHRPVRAAAGGQLKQETEKDKPSVRPPQTRILITCTPTG